MGFAKYPPDSFDSEDLDRIEAAFDGIWAAIVAADPLRNTDNDETLKADIHRKLLTLSHNGVVDLDLLTKLTLETSPILAALREGR